MKFRFFLGYEKHWDGTWVVCDASKSNTNFTKDVNNETHMKTISTKSYYCLHVILFGPTLLIWLQFDVLSTTEIYVIFFHISAGNYTPTQNPIKRIMKTGLTANWCDNVSNLICCFSCFILYACFCWWWTNGRMWCHCFTKQRININPNYSLDFFLFRHFR